MEFYGNEISKIERLDCTQNQVKQKNLKNCHNIQFFISIIIIILKKKFLK